MISIAYTAIQKKHKMNFKRIKFIRIKNSVKRFNPLNFILGFFSSDLGIDLGTSNTLVYIKNKGVVIREPSAVARHKKTKEILAIGLSAKKMLGRAPSTIEVIRPLKNGVIADFDAASSILTYYIKKVHETGGTIPKIPRPHVVVGIPSGVTEVERRAVADAVRDSGARRVDLVEEPMAAAIGAGLPVESPEGCFIVDIGGGTSEIAVISLGGIVLGRSLRVAGDEMDEAIVNYVKLKYSLLLGQPSAEAVKIAIASAVNFEKPKNYVVRGRDLETGLPRSVKLTDDEIREALGSTIQEIIAGISDTLEETPPELISDIMERGIYLAGGGSLIYGIDKAISEATKMPVFLAEDPLTCVARGCGKLLENPLMLNRLKITKGL
ncbi:MAG: Cell shape determining protein MreB [Candidatus Woesebacteria bacterium GW2011_GWC1_30_29]|uniref:Cell shape-determining protein MreB n=1 Tax=Candidatus Woesebacteria bacterium GW2011_GWC2_31_9 TaxID=1618586 RepID=A0A0F9YLD4_9BACT|nr:MAG: Cell shape determining protein MreB [Candidatus Woesebacteria bacterium GW2011_GWC1_30_29]KKP26693.1 MAG: Cell shape determining protein MreB [Candidatus Woesebacteria bacterium GW2011_GWD1_31_12]KKP28067.1 MAG: Cell shape determining protein MreB [Candidatus Woesebacteria bacterium GW2011_GWB1_31_29]KKP32264.1 MAG: Cell shape determining protein MreB [Candidatus Woesebacteria bacterium GW2011_GWC2_31_9]KKP33624.1 MAG: Cell shape determining protein MreB [Candidatus Woesebacteria bacter